MNVGWIVLCEISSAVGAPLNINSSAKNRVGPLCMFVGGYGPFM